jgi:hypothetical protein
MKHRFQQVPCNGWHMSRMMRQCLWTPHREIIYIIQGVSSDVNHNSMAETHVNALCNEQRCTALQRAMYTLDQRSIS